MSHSMQRRDFLIAAAASGMACLSASSAGAFKADPPDNPIQTSMSSSLSGNPTWKGFPALKSRTRPA